MNPEDISSNPFAALFPSLDHAKQFQQTSLQNEMKDDQKVQSEGSGQQSSSRDKQQEAQELNAIVESIFLVTFDPGCYPVDSSVDTEPQEDFSRPLKCVYMEEVAAALGNPTVIGQDTLEQVVFERIMLEPKDITAQLRARRKTKRDAAAAAVAAGEADELVYLCQCYSRCQQQQHEFKTSGAMDKYAFAVQCEKVIIMNGKMCLQQPLCFHSQNFVRQFLDILREDLVIQNGPGQGVEFLQKVCEEIHNCREDATLQEVLSEILDHVHNLFKTKLNLIHGDVSRYLVILSFFTSSAILAEVFMTYNTPAMPNSGVAYEATLLGSILCLSCIPKSEIGPYEFFNNPSSHSKQEHDITESNLWTPLSTVCEGVYNLLFNIIKLSPDLRNTVLTWLGKCLHANAGRSKLWSSMPQLFSRAYSSEGFALNLCYVLLRLSQPFAKPLSPKLLKIQPSYTAVVVADDAEANAIGVHAKGLHEETPLVTKETVQPLPKEASYGFVTELFFMTHQAIRLGFSAVHDKLVKLNQDLHRVQRVYHDARSQVGSDEDEPVRSIKQQMEKGMTLFFSMKAALSQTQLLEMSLNFHLATASWLCQVATQPLGTSFQPVTFPLPRDTMPALTHIPEHILGNLTDFVLFMHQFKDDMFDVAGDSIQHLMTLVLVFMGSPQRIKNPHLRAELADMLAALIPSRKESTGIFAKYAREQAFKAHPLVSHLSETLLHVFVSIEMTGQAVEFEQKFNYRRPMYLTLDYIWEIELHQEAIKELAEYAEAHIEEADAPLFLRFINLLVNDATFLLDEALSYMSQIKTKQQEKESGSWNDLPPQQRQEQEGLLRQLGMMARYHNVMANHTIHALQQLTTHIKSIFCHPTFVDRLSAMLNYFLCQLDLEEQRNEEEEQLTDAPEEFLDPILGTLMSDPVRLPTSNTTMDRAVIARHILSDQTDPFSRKPLTMDMVEANTELKERIQQWIKEKKSKS